MYTKIGYFLPMASACINQPRKLTDSVRISFTKRVVYLLSG